jgi:hypothetical protein
MCFTLRNVGDREQMLDPRTLTQTLGGDWRGNAGNARCPACQPERNADQRGLSIGSDDGRPPVFCHKTGCNFDTILKATESSHESGSRNLEAFRKDCAGQKKSPSTQLLKARKPWATSPPISGRFGEENLMGRGKQ